MDKLITPIIAKSLEVHLDQYNRQRGNENTREGDEQVLKGHGVRGCFVPNKNKEKNGDSGIKKPSPPHLVTKRAFFHWVAPQGIEPRS